MQDVQQLALIFMQSLDLHIENRTGVYLNTVVLQNVFCQTHFVLILDIHELLLCLFIIRIDFQLIDLRQIGDPVVSHMCRYPVRKKRIAV